MTYRIGEVSRLTGVPAYVLRFWQREFPTLAPGKTGGGQRLFTERDVAMVENIKELLYERHYTHEGARTALAATAAAAGGEEPGGSAAVARDRLRRIREELSAILRQLGS
ncbi:MAG: MerR family transcriptional regulator [Candidatus Schekmanbacteria bacterium]|nr:MerR family transcriptional regulator [Candidatus Schekmanbacteria bacterium]